MEGKIMATRPPDHRTKPAGDRGLQAGGQRLGVLPRVRQNCAGAEIISPCPSSGYSRCWCRWLDGETFLPIIAALYENENTGKCISQTDQQEEDGQTASQSVAGTTGHPGTGRPALRPGSPGSALGVGAGADGARNRKRRLLHPCSPSQARLALRRIQRLVPGGQPDATTRRRSLADHPRAETGTVSIQVPRRWAMDGRPASKGKRPQRARHA